MASKEVEVLDPAATVEKDKETASLAALNRRYFMAALGVAGAAAGAALVSGPSAVHAQQPIPNGFSQIDIVNFLLNVQYLKATIYSFLCNGADLPASSGVTQGTGGVYNQMTKFTFSGLVNNAQTIDLFNEMYYDELNGLISLRSLLGSSAAGRATMNLFGTGTTTTAATTPSVNQAIGIARFLEDVSVQAFAYATEYLSGQNLAYVSQVLAVNGFHAGALRLICIQNGIPYLSPQDMTSTSTSGGQTVNSFTGGTILGSPTMFAILPVATASTPSPVVVGSIVSGAGVPAGTVISAVTPAPLYTGTINGSATVPTNQITGVAPLTGLAVGQVISGTGIPANSTIKSIVGSTITLNFTVAIPSTGVGFDINGNPTSTSPVSGGIVTAATGVALTVGFAAVATKTTGLNTVSTVAGLSVGQPISGTNIAANTTITAIGPGNNITISPAASGSSTVAPTGIVSKGSNMVTSVSSVNGLAVGQPITGTGIPSSTTVTAFDPVGLTITMSAVATATSTVSPKGVLVTGSNTVTGVSSLSGLVSGLPITQGSGIPANAYILGVGGTNTFTMQIGTGTPPTFTTPPTPANATASTSTTPALTTAGVLTAGSSIVTNVVSLNGFASGVPISGANIPAGTTITAISAVTAAQPWTITLSAPAIGTTATTVTASPTGVVTASSPYITQLSSFTGISVGNAILGNNIPLGASVGSINTATTITFTGVYNSGSAAVSSVSSTLGLAAGQPISGTGIPSGATILSVGTNAITLSANATAASNPSYAGVLVATVTNFSVDPVPQNSITMTSAASGSIATETITFTTNQTMFTLPQTSLSVLGATETVTIPTIQTINPALGSITMSNNATSTGGATLTVVTADSQDVEPADPGAISFSGILTNGSLSVTGVSNVTGLVAGLLVTGPNIAAGTTIATVTPPVTGGALGSITLSAQATGGATTPVNLFAYAANAATLAGGGKYGVTGTSPNVYQSFFDTANADTSSANTPAGFAFTRTFSQVLAALYGSTLPSTYQGGFFPNGVGGSINVV